MYPKLIGAKKIWFINAVFSRDVLIHGSYTVALGCIVTLMLILAYFQKDKVKRKLAYLVTLWTLLSGVYYALIMYFLYETEFDEREASYLASYERYMNTFIVCAVMLCLYLLFDGRLWMECKKILPIVLAVVSFDLFFVHVTAFAQAVPGTLTHDDEQVATYMPDADQINTAPADSHVYILDYGDNGNDIYHLLYYCDPRYISGGSIGKPANDDDIWTRDLSTTDVITEASECGFLYTRNIDAGFADEYNSAFADPSLITNKVLYKIDSVQNGQLVLSYYQYNSSELNKITVLNEYLSKLQDGDYTIFISIKDEGSRFITNERQKLLWELGVDKDLRNQSRKSYYAVLENGKAIAEDLGDGLLTNNGTLANGTSFSIQSQGWTQREAVQSIVQNNLYGLDIDERAAQLAYFAMMMKARQYDRRFFDRAIEPHIYEIRESNVITLDMVEYFANGDRKLKKDMETLIHDLRDAREYGSILNVTVVDFQAIYARFDEIQEDISVFVLPIMNELLPLVKRAEAMAQKYHVAVTNPPYMGTKGMNSKVASFLKDNYPEGKGDLFAAFITKLEAFAKKYGYFALVTQRTWLFISAFEKLRIALLETSTGVSFVELGAGAFEDLAGEVVQSVLFCMQKGKVNNYTSFYCDVTQFDDKEKAFLNADQKRTCIDDFELFPGYTFAMKLSAVSMAAYKKGKTVGMIAQPKKGLISSDNNRFLRLWPEVSIDRVQFRLSKMDHQDTTKRWLPHNKGGSFRRWYGNQEYLINWENNGAEVKGYAAKLYGSYSRQIMNEKYYL